jgi:hypothetical protein
MTPPSPGSGPAPGNSANGPEWLADLFFSPPPWLNLSLKLAAGLTAVVVAYRLYQWEGSIPLDVQREMQIVVAHITGILTATLVCVNLTRLSYELDIALGFAVGYTIVLLFQTTMVAGRLPLPAEPRERIAVVWLTLAGSVIALPTVVMTRDLGMALLKTRFLLAVIATGMLAYNVAILTGVDIEELTSQHA